MKSEYSLESDLCADFITWAKLTAPDVRAFAEWAGWDMLLAYPQGWQLGIQAKLRLSPEVIDQAAPDRWHGLPERRGPDFRAVLVPKSNGLSAIAERLGLVVFAPMYRSSGVMQFCPDLHRSYSKNNPVDSGWLDWNPTRRHELPTVETTDAVAGSPCPVTLTPWKLKALVVIAELESAGTITTKRIRELGVDPRRWTECRWIVPGDSRGIWKRGTDCPRFEEQHPTAYAAAVAQLRPEEPTTSARR